MKRKPIAIGCAVVAIIVICIIGYIWYAITVGGRRHGEWHICRDNCWLFDDAKRICAEQRGLTAGAEVTWQDVQPFFTNSEYWGYGRYQVSPSEIPKCPAGGTYTLRPVGYWSMCSVPYHQWINCMSKTNGSAWRNYEEPNHTSDGIRQPADGSPKPSR